MVVMGRVTAPFGIKGWFKVYTLTAQPDNLCEYPVWWLRRDGDWREMKVAAAKVQGNTLVAQLAGIEDREGAAALKGFDIGVPREQLPDAEGGEFYWADLIGLRVVNTQREELGRVARIVQTGANDVLVVAGGSGEQRGEGDQRADGNKREDGNKRAGGAKREDGNKRAGGAKREDGNKRAGGAKREEAREILIPFIADAIKEVDITAGVIAVDWGRDY